MFDKIFGKTLDRFGEALAKVFGIPLDVLAFFAALVLVTGTLWTTLYAPFATRTCENLNANFFDGRFDACVVGSKFADFVGGIASDLIGGGGGPLSPEQQAVFEGSLQNDQTNVAIPPYQIVAIREIENGTAVSVTNAAFIYTIPWENPDKISSTWDWANNKQVVVWARVLNAVGQDMVRITEQGHPAPMYLSTNSVDTNLLPALSQLRLTNPPKPNGVLPTKIGPELSDGTNAFEVWGKLRDTGNYPINARTVEVLKSLSEVGPEWLALYDTANKVYANANVAEQRLLQLDMWQNNGGENVSDTIHKLGEANIALKVVVIETKLVHDGTELVTIQAETKIGDVIHNVGEQYQLQAGLLRPAVKTLEPGQALTERGK